MRKAVFVSFAILLLSLISLLQVVEPTKANPIPPSDIARVLHIAVDNPPNGSTQSQSFMVDFHADETSRLFSLSNSNLSAPYHGDFFYTLDGQDRYTSGVKIEDVEETDAYNDLHLYTGTHFDGYVYLSNLASGNNSVSVYWGVIGENGIISSTVLVATSQFFVDQQITPQPTPSTDPTSTVPEFFSWTLPLLLSIMAATAALLVYHKKHKCTEA